MCIITILHYCASFPYLSLWWSVVVGHKCANTRAGHDWLGRTPELQRQLQGQWILTIQVSNL